MRLEENLIRYKEVTLTIIKIVKDEEYEKLDELFKQRQLILDNINEIGFVQEELKQFYSQYDMNKLEGILSSEMKAKKEDLLEKIKENKKRQVAMNGYNNLSTRAVFLSREF